MNKSKLLDLLEEQRITEKTARCAQSNQYVFKVRKEATKKTIKEVIETTFNVSVTRCNILNRKGKFKARRNGHTKSFKVAYVTLAQGQELNLAE